MKWFYDHWVVTTLFLLTFLGLIAAVTLKVFFDPVAVPAGTATAFGTFFALPTLAVALLKWRSKKAHNDDQ